jgi:hypothetical protein
MMRMRYGDRQRIGSVWSGVGGKARRLRALHRDPSSVESIAFKARTLLGRQSH